MGTQPPQPASGSSRPSGGAATAPPRGAFVGREAELGALLAGLDEAVSGRGSLVLVAGEPGIGKTRLADELASRAREREATVLWGRCWEAGGAPAYWPWVQSIRSHIRTQPRHAIRAQMGVGASDIAQMMPEILDLFPDLPEPPTLDPEAARFQLFDSTSTFLRNAAQDQPMVLILDDLHAADAPSLLLLRFMASEVGRTRALIIGAYRDVALDPDHPISSTLTELVREPAVRRLPLEGLAETDVARYIELTTGSGPPSSVVEAVHRETEGNPLFVGEVVRLLASEGRLDHVGASWRAAVPESIRDVIGQRLEHLSEPSREILGLASVLGREFSLDALKRVSGRTTSDLLGMLGEAAEAKVVTDAPGALGRLRFSHALIRDALYEGLPLPRRLELHRRSGEALEEIYVGEPEPHLAELAHHFFESAPAGQAAKAILYARRAGDRAASLLAYEEAIRLYAMALEVLALEERPDPQDQCDLLLAIGDAQTKAGDGDGSRQTFLQAAAIAKRLGSPTALARAALGYGGRFVWGRAGRDRNIVPLLEDALAALGEASSEQRVRVLARLAGALRDQRQREPRWSLAREAVEMARRIGDPGAIAYALESRFAAIWEPETLTERTDIATEMTLVAEQSGDAERALQGLGYKVHAQIEWGDMSAAAVTMAAESDLAANLRQPAWRWLAAVGRAAVALFEGRFREAEPLIQAALAVGRQAQGMDAEVSFTLQTYMLRREQGRASELEITIRRSVEEYPWYPMFRSVLADLYVQTGREAAARHLFQDLAQEDFAVFPVDSQWLFAMSLLPDVAAFLEDEKAARALERLLRPWAQQNVYGVPEVIGGSAWRCLGIAAATAGHLDEAAAHFEHALDLNAAMGSVPWTAHTQHGYARMLLTRDAPGDPERAVELLRSARETAVESGMTALAGRVTALLADLGVTGVPEREAGTPPTGAPRAAIFRREGDYWSIAYDGRAVRLKDAKGLRYIHRLLAEPGRELHVAELASENRPAVSEVTAVADGLRVDSGHAGEILDAQARAEYARRIEDLREEVEEASRWGDQQREARAQEEIDFISRELASAYGLGGRARRATDVAERIRKAVTNRIRYSLSRIEKEHPVLARHLANAIATGTFCSYAPDRAVSWTL